ncbi:hypothetical protein PATSB16_15140 [Pandoraea thiooxydans]|uniref:HTH araC/xylS-type domain-containing protein n=1 Tax=Pandoraea thiooxydans TaxID=445709 RepID=A0A0G3EL78_9BURK|nr:AraC family transcriptional regulator [Pandoraea thiooxydans]AKJ67720.1 hypothetical protein ABW99_05250 [Pandoraea thiooxydans]APR94856.1 hypothetical protein PATSB16_15140 [Pandoraea thiooxydans]
MNGARRAIGVLWTRAALPFPLRVPLTATNQLELRGVDIPYALRIQMLSGTLTLTGQPNRRIIHAGQDAELPPGTPVDYLLAAKPCAGIAARAILTFETDHHAGCMAAPEGTSLAAALGRQVFRAPNAQWRADTLARRCQLPQGTLHGLLAQDGTNLAAVVERQRVFAALVQMMTTGLALEQIASAVGLGTPTAMSEAFRRVVCIDCDALERAHIRSRRLAHRHDDTTTAHFPARLPRGFFSGAQPGLT